MRRRDVLIGMTTSVIAATQGSTSARFYQGTARYVPGWSSRYFEPAELASRGNGRLRIEKDMIRAHDHVRSEIGRPIWITSGYRDPHYNRRIGGARRSQHVAGLALDIDLAGFSSWDRYVLMWHLIDQRFTSFGSYAHKPNMLHADRRSYAVIWRRGGGRYPHWFRRALNEWLWTPGSGSAYR